MKYMLLIVEDAPLDSVPEAQRREVFGQIDRWWGDLAQKGKMVEGAQLQPPHTATTLKMSNGKVVVTDGPFLEAKETIGGYGILDVANLDEAIAIAKTWPGAGILNRKLEIRPVLERPGM